jgi:hypothetical protein
MLSLRPLCVATAILVSASPGKAAVPAQDAPLSASFQVLAGWRIPDALFKAKPGHVLRFVPGKIRQLDGKQVAVTGFMMPIRVHDKRVTEFMLLRTQNTCCFGIPPELNEVVEVLRIGTPSKVLMDAPITVVGTLRVKERWEGSFLCSIYQLDAERVVE